MTDRQLLELLLEKVTNVETEQKGMKSDITGMKGEITGIKNDIPGMKDEMQLFRIEQERQGDLLHQLIKIIGETNNKVENLAMEMHQGFERIETDISILFDENLNRKRETVRLQQNLQRIGG